MTHDASDLVCPPPCEIEHPIAWRWLSLGAEKTSEDIAVVLGKPALDDDGEWWCVFNIVHNGVVLESAAIFGPDSMASVVYSLHTAEIRARAVALKLGANLTWWGSEDLGFKIEPRFKGT